MLRNIRSKLAQAARTSAVVQAVGVGASGALAAVGAELAARGLIRRFGGHYRYVPRMRVCLAIDRDALPSLSPTARFFINEDGERGGPPPAKGERAYRALVVGGSAAECALLDQDEAWPAVIERVLAEPENARALGVTRVHVGGVARAILRCAHVDLLLRRILPRYEDRLDLVIVMVGAADIVSWMERGMPREFDDRALDLSKIFEQHPEGPWGAAPKRTALWRVVSAMHRRVRDPIIVKPGGDWLHRVRRMRASAETMIDEVPDAAPVLAHYEKHLGALLATARAGAKRVLVVRQPWRSRLAPGDERAFWNFGLGRPYRDDVKAYFTPRVIDLLMQRVDALTVKVADEMGVEHVDLMGRLEQTSDVFYDELHFTPRGAEQVGRIAADAILAPRKR